MSDDIKDNAGIADVATDELIPCIEAILFASGEPVSYAKLSAVLEIPMWKLMNIMNDFKEKYNSEHKGVELLLYEESAQLCTRAEYGDIVRKALTDRAKGQLSRAAFETLSIIAYKQPVTKAYIEQVRGVESSNTVNLLCDKGLVEICGRLDVPGRPFTYATTDNFLRCFGIRSVDELPPLESFAENDGENEESHDEDAQIKMLDAEDTSNTDTDQNTEE